MRQQNVKSPDANAATLPRPLSPGAAALGKALSRAWSLPPQRNQVAVERDLQVPMSDGTLLSSRAGTHVPSADRSTTARSG